MALSFTRFAMTVVSIFLFTIGLFYISAFLNLIFLLKLAVLYVDYWYVVLPLEFIVSYVLWHRGFRNLASIIIVVNTSLLLLGGAIYILWMALTEY